MPRALRTFYVVRPSCILCSVQYDACMDTCSPLSLATIVPRCAACAADDGDIGTFDHGVPHTLDDDCTVPRWAVRCCGRTGNHAFHDIVHGPASTVMVPPDSIRR